VKDWGAGVQLVPLGTWATNWPIVPAPGDYADGEFGGIIICRGNRSARRKLAPLPICPAWAMARPGTTISLIGHYVSTILKLFLSLYPIWGKCFCSANFARVEDVCMWFITEIVELNTSIIWSHTWLTQYRQSKQAPGWMWETLWCLLK
jgi:hypothetical protein